MIDNKIKVQIFGEKHKEVPIGCTCEHNESSPKGCRGTDKGSCKGCNSGCKENTISNNTKTLEEIFKELKQFIESSDIKNNVKFEFIDLEEINIKEKYQKIWEIKNKGFEPPITVIDNIIRYYGGISAALIYKDVKELLE